MTVFKIICKAGPFKGIMTRDEIIDYCLTFPQAYEDHPFDVIFNDDTWTVMRHQTNKKGFAFIYTRDGNLCVNLKCDPAEADFFRQVYTDVTPGFHMNKDHWNTVIIGGDVPDQELLDMISRSYDLIKPNLRMKKIKAVQPLTVNTNELWPKNLYYHVFGEFVEEVPDNAEAAIEYVLNMLKKRDKAIVLARLKHYKTYAAIGREFHITGNRVAQVLQKNIRMMKNPARSRFLVDLNGQLQHDSDAEEAAREVRFQIVEKRKAEIVEGSIDEITLEDLDLTVRSYNCLRRAGIGTLTDISGLTLKELYGVRNLGRKGALEVLTVCEKYGVFLAGEI